MQLLLCSLYVADKMIRDLAGEDLRWARLAVLCLIVIGGSLLVMTFVGMEHNLQILTILVLAHSAIRVLRKKHGGGTALCLAGVAAVLTRYEAVFAVVIIFVFLLWGQRVRLACSFAVASALPVVLYSVYGLLHGALILPDSLLLKTQESNWWRPFPSIEWPKGYTTFILFSGGMFLGIFVLLICLDRLVSRKILSSRDLQILLYFETCLLLFHYEFAKTGWATRYEAYLVVLAIVCCGVLGISVAIRQASPSLEFLTASSSVVLLALLLIPRIYLSDWTLRGGFKQIYMQQFQMARFLAASYPLDTVAVNDIGLVSYWEPRSIVDVFGLASPEITRLKLKGAFNADALSRISNREGARVAVVYAPWLGRALPSQWTLVGTWRMPKTWLGAPVLGGDSVNFYAVNAGDAEGLRRALSSYAPCLPQGVIQAGYNFQMNGSCTAPPVPAGWIW